MAVYGKTAVASLRTTVGPRLSVQDWFFDTPAVMRRVDADTRRRMAQAGRYLMQTARRLMRKVADAGVGGRVMGGPWMLPRASAPGDPPLAHARHPWLRGETGSRYGIFFAYDPATHSVVVGPNLMPGRPYNVPALHEKGGRVMLRNRRRRVRRVGGVGEIRLGGPAGRSTRTVRDVRLVEQRVTYARLRTTRQARRANQLNQLIYGRANWYPAHFPPRPFMAPAFLQCRAKLGEILTGQGMEFWHTSGVGVAVEGEA